MKTLLATLLLVTTVSFSQENTQLNSQLNAIISTFDTVRTFTSWSKKFMEIENLKTENASSWQVNYYSTFAAIQLSYLGKDEVTKDLYLDLAEENLLLVDSLCPAKDDVFALKAFVANARLLVDGMSRWKTYGVIFEENLAKGKAINPNNPHLAYLKGMSLYYQPKMFGGGAEAALPYFEKAKELFFAQTVKDADHPFWGFGPTMYFIGECAKGK